MGKAIITNPNRKKNTMALLMKPKKRKKTATKRNPSKAKTRTKWRTRTITKTVRAKRRRNPSKKVSRKRRRNPSGKLKSFLPMLTGTVLPIGGGLVLSLFGTRYIPAIVPARARGLIPGILGTALAVFTRSNMLRNVGYGVAAGGVLDLARQNIPMLALSEASLLSGGDILSLQSDSMQMLSGDPLNTLGESGPLNTLGDFDLL